MLLLVLCVFFLSLLFFVGFCSVSAAGVDGDLLSFVLSLRWLVSEEECAAGWHHAI